MESQALDGIDRSASWIGRWTDPAHRVLRSIDSDEIAWIGPGEALGQAFTAPGRFTAVCVDLVCEGEPLGRLELRDPTGVVASTVIEVGGFRWDRFAHYLELAEPAGPGEYQVELSLDSGRVGWRTRTAPASPAVDDGVSPRPIDGVASRDGVAEPGTRAIGVETVPAPNPVFRKDFEVIGGVREARLTAVGLGYGVFRINGREVTEDVLEPAQTAYDRTILHRSYDVTPLLETGRNTITAELGRGFYAARGANTWGWNLAPWHREPVMLAHLEHLDDAGVRHVVASGPDWQAAAGPTTEDLLYTGETADARTEKRWEQAIVVPPPGGVLREATAPPVRRTEVLAAQRETVVGDTTVHDFGTILAGRVRCTISGEPGAEVVVRHAEQFAEDGTVRCDNALAAGESQVDRFVLGPEPVTWEPQFSYKGFRYASVQVRGRAEVSEVRAVRLATTVAEAGSFVCEDETLSWIDAATARTFLNNLHGVPTDTPVYEKNGWTADAHLGTDAALHHFDLRESLVKWLDDHVDARDATGMVPMIVPTPGWGREPDPAWSASMVLIPWNLYWEYGDRALLERYADPVRGYTDRLLELADGGLWRGDSWGDWLSPGHWHAPEGPEPTATMMLYRVTARTAEICQVLGMGGEAERYRDAGRTIAAAYHAKYFDERSATYRSPEAGYRQSMNVLPLAFGAVPTYVAGAVGAGLVDDVEERAKGHLDCGAVAAKHLLPVLADVGRADLAVTVATRPDRPGWGIWRRLGMETLMESWDDTARSHNHYFLGAASAWIQQRIGGLRATSPGWRTFDIAPVHDDRVTWADVRHTTPEGHAGVAWRRRDDTWEFEVEVPEGSVATVRLPGQPPARLPGGRHGLSRPATPGAGQ
ncbi:family 78 glycoside hydrolase catalytic domain [Saccharopolyspora mangrovi]|uniref:alpha-L-rhamnosidase n=1 Tax=Saccharopolyspora mangrovi TaxID=3082379 RepID=A0ABU6A6N1_9PSEU|nr:family 78 glycoside hydrolase catalytic domain [Saccharopolyspora sp. S2-29]MEB3367181.1 family 78 glycoside hydrolase catalytic domain [Saccharopolyspora sp. S2-29]